MKPTMRNAIILAAVVIITAAIVAFLLFPGTEGEAEFELPTSAPTPESARPSQEGGGSLQVDRDNILAVLQTLERTETYIRTLRFATYWNGGESSVNIHVAAKGPNYYIVREDGFESKRVLMLDDDFWIWYGDERTNAFHGERGGERTREVDELMQLITYESLADKPGFQVIDAGFVEYDSHWCIFMEYSYDAGIPYESRIYISLDYGIIVAEETKSLGELVFLVTTDMETWILSTPPESAFIPPNVNPTGT